MSNPFLSKLENKSSFKFVLEKNLPENVLLLSAINFIFLGAELLLFRDENNLWSPRLTGYVKMDNFHIVGYFVVDKDATGGLKTIQPVVYSFVKNIGKSWGNPRDGKVDIFSRTNAMDLFKSRDDDGKMLSAYLHVMDSFDREVSCSYSYTRDAILDNVEVASVMVFCLNQDKKVCVVRDSGEDFLSLPGGGKHLSETSLEAAKRELFEEAQIVGRDFRILGSILVSFTVGGRLVSTMQQARYLCEADEVGSFVPNMGGFETDFRDFISVDRLGVRVKQLQNSTGEEILGHLLSLL